MKRALAFLIVVYFTGVGLAQNPAASRRKGPSLPTVHDQLVRQFRAQLSDFVLHGHHKEP